MINVNVQNRIKGEAGNGWTPTVPTGNMQTRGTPGGDRAAERMAREEGPGPSGKASLWK